MLQRRDVDITTLTMPPSRLRLRSVDVATLTLFRFSFRFLLHPVIQHPSRAVWMDVPGNVLKPIADEGHVVDAGGLYALEHAMISYRRSIHRPIDRSIFWLVDC